MEEKQMKSYVKASKHGSAEAFGKLYAENAADLYRFAFWYLKNDADAQDAVQDACLKAFENIRSLRNEEVFRTWFFKILANVCKSRLLSKNKTNIIPMEQDDTLLTLADTANEAMQNKCELNELISTLPEPEKSIVLLSVVGGFSSKEIQTMLKINASTVRSKLMRSLRILREQIE